MDLVAALRSLFRDRRKEPRRRPGRGEKLLVGIKSLDDAASELLFAQVRDISERGLSAAVKGGGPEMAALRESRELSLIIRLPANHTLTARGTLVYARPLEKGREHLIGASFTVISSADRERLRAYLAALP